jgi:hypothetical protein
VGGIQKRGLRNRGRRERAKCVFQYATETRCFIV